MYSPVKGIKGEDAKLVIVVAVTSALEEELCELGYMLTEEGNFLQRELQTRISDHCEERLTRMRSVSRTSKR